MRVERKTVYLGLVSGLAISVLFPVYVFLQGFSAAAVILPLAGYIVCKAVSRKAVGMKNQARIDRHGELTQDMASILCVSGTATVPGLPQKVSVLMLTATLVYMRVRTAAEGGKNVSGHILAAGLVPAAVMTVSSYYGTVIAVGASILVLLEAARSIRDL